MSNVYLLLGGNIGDMQQNLEDAITNISSKIGKILTISSIYETEPWGFTDENNFSNQVVYIITKLQPSDLLKEIKNIEHLMGRKAKRGENYESRIIDIDILFYDSISFCSKDLTIPHPRICERRFTLEPLNEIAPTYIHPVEEKTISILLKECSDKLKVIKLKKKN